MRLHRILSSFALFAPIFPLLLLLQREIDLVVATTDGSQRKYVKTVPTILNTPDSKVTSLPGEPGSVVSSDDGIPISITINTEEVFVDAPTALHSIGTIRIENTVSELTLRFS